MVTVHGNRYIDNNITANAIFNVLFKASINGAEAGAGDHVIG
jgi:hypothetical protein